MSAKTKIFLLYIGVFLVGILFLWKMLGVPIEIIILLTVSILIIYFISKKQTPFTLSVSIIIIFINLLAFVFILIPTYSKNADIANFYKNRENFLKINIENKEKLKKNRAKIYIKNPQRNKTDTIKLGNSKKDKIQKKVLSGDIISFISRTKEMDTVANIHLWDGTIIRLLPQSTIKMNKLIKKTELLTESQTEVEVDKGEVRFNVIKTITDNEGFNIKTNNGTLVIRGTAGFVKKSSEKKTIAYSEDHLIEIKNKEGNSKFLPKGKVMSFSGNSFSEIPLEKFYQKLNNFTRKKIKRFPSLDKKRIQEYKQQLKYYIQENLSWNLSNKPKIESLAHLKMQILSLFDKKQKENLRKFKEYKMLTSGKTTIEQYAEKANKYIFVPLNKNTQKLKKEFLKEYSKINEEGMKNYIINLYNKALEKGEEIDVDKINELINKNRGKILENEYYKRLENFYFENINKITK